MAIDLKELWRSASDEDLVKARENFDSIREEAQGGPSETFLVAAEEVPAGGRISRSNIAL